MGNTVWTKKAKEGFTETEDTSNRDGDGEGDEVKVKHPADYGNNQSNGDKNTEDVLIGKPVEKDAQTTPTPTPTPTQPLKPLKTQLKKVKDVFKPNFDVSKAKQVLNEIKNAFGNKLNIREPIEKILQIIIGKKFSSPTSKEEIHTVATHIMTWLSFLLTYVILINWWYMTNYNRFVLDFRKFIWGPIRWIIGGPLNAIESVTYVAINSRMDADRKFPSKETLAFLWGLRPIIFTILHIIIVLVILKANLPKLLRSFMSKDGFGYIILVLLSFYHSGTLFAREKWYEPVLSAGMPISIILAVLLILSIVLAITIIPLFLGTILTLYLTFLSTMPIIVFNGFWPPSIWSSVNQIFQELTEVYTGTNIYGKLLFNHLHSIYILLFSIVIISKHFAEITKFKTPALVILALAINIIFLNGFGIIRIIKMVYNILKNDDNGSSSLITPPE